jgi:hypothetical protein
MRFAAYFALFVGFLMVVQWAVSLAGGQVPELKTAPWEIALHLVAEAATALLLIAAGAGLLRKAAWAPSLYLVAGGMLLYTLIVSPGYFAQRGEWAPVVMFAVLSVGALLAIRKVFAVGLAR